MKAIGLIASAFLLFAAACAPERDIRQPPMRLRIMYTPWPGYYPLVVAREKGFFEKNGLELELVRSQGLRGMAEFASHIYDGAVLSLGSIIAIANRTRDIRIVAIIDRSDGADAIVARPNIAFPVKGSRIGVLIGGFGELLVYSMLEEAGFAEQDVVLVNADSSHIPELLRSGKIDGGQTREPFVSQAVREGCRVVYSSKDSDQILDVLAFSNQVLEKKHAAVRAFMDGWFQGVEFCLQEPQQARAIISRALNIPPEECSLEGIKLFTRHDNRRSFSAVSGGFESIYSIGDVYARFYLRMGNAAERINMATILNDSFL